MNIDKVIRKERKTFESNGFKYRWFPNEHTFDKGDFHFCIYTYGENYQVIYYKNLFTSLELSFSFDKVEFRDREKNATISSIRHVHENCESLKLLLDFILNNCNWLENLREEDILFGIIEKRKITIC